MSDEVVTQEQLCDLTGVKMCTPCRAVKIASVLRKAGIVHWVRHDGSIATTWHHVKCANPNPQAEIPKDMPRIGQAR